MQQVLKMLSDYLKYGQNQEIIKLFEIVNGQASEENMFKNIF